jgi:hypothetical protein
MLRINITAASRKEPDEFTINMGEQFPAEVSEKLNTLAKGSEVTIYPKLPRLKNSWPWTYVVNRENQTMTTRFITPRVTRPRVGRPTALAISAIKIDDTLFSFA